MHQALGLEAMLPQPREARCHSRRAQRQRRVGPGRQRRTLCAHHLHGGDVAGQSVVHPQSYGASIGLFAGNVVGKGTQEQIERFALPVMRCERVGAWALTEPWGRQ